MNRSANSRWLNWLPFHGDNLHHRVHAPCGAAPPAELLAAFCHLRGQEITDNLVDVLIETVHRIGAKAEQRVERELIEDLKRVSGKNGLLFQLAEAALAHPDGIVREVVFPVVDEQTLNDLVREWKATGPVYRQTLQAVMRNSYRSHYRRMLPALLDTLQFRPNNDMHRPMIRALDLNAPVKILRLAENQIEHELRRQRTVDPRNAVSNHFEASQEARLRSKRAASAVMPSPAAASITLSIAAPSPSANNFVRAPRL